MAEAYYPVGPGLGMEENFLSLDDILMSQEKLPGRAESALPRLAVLLGQGAGSAESIPEVTGRGPGTRDCRCGEGTRDMGHGTVAVGRAHGTWDTALSLWDLPGATTSPSPPVAAPRPGRPLLMGTAVMLSSTLPEVILALLYTVCLIFFSSFSYAVSSTDNY